MEMFALKQLPTSQRFGTTNYDTKSTKTDCRMQAYSVPRFQRPTSHAQVHQWTIGHCHVVYKYEKHGMCHGAFGQRNDCLARAHNAETVEMYNAHHRFVRNEVTKTE